eukprot:3668119-Pyramimonas_sp.AAC.1
MHTSLSSEEDTDDDDDVESEASQSEDSQVSCFLGVQATCRSLTCTWLVGCRSGPDAASIGRRRTGGVSSRRGQQSG